ncbi:MAG: hypothetical protein O4804_08130 [Trichodesmium sp. St11_bin5]|nr:hypothetical protein [Trichodesmium sp. St11_bin5]
MLFVLASITSNIVGSIFLLTGIAKVIEPWKFAQHITKLNLVNPKLIIPVALTFTAIESALGVDLILGVFLNLIIYALPITLTSYRGKGMCQFPS